VYSKNSPGSNTVSVRLPSPHFSTFDHVDGNVFGRVTEPAQLGAITSVITIFSRSKSQLFVTLILNTASAHSATS